MPVRIKFYEVWFKGQYGNPDRFVVCSKDEHGVWRGPTGTYMSTPEPERIGQEVNPSKAQRTSGDVKPAKSLGFRRAFAVTFGIIMGVGIAGLALSVLAVLLDVWLDGACAWPLT